MAEEHSGVTGFGLATLKQEGTIQNLDTGKVYAPGDEGFDEMKADCDRRSAAYGEELRQREEKEAAFEQWLKDREATSPHGIIPTRFTVLVKPDPEPDVTKGGIMIPIQYRDQKQAAAVTGRVIDIADEAFSFVSDPEARRPEIGDRVVFTKYAGLVVPGDDGQIYKLMNDEDISGVLTFDPK